MKDKELIRKLNSVGKTVFATNFSLFKSFAERAISRQRCINSLVLSGVSNEEGAAIRTSNAELIFRSCREYDALLLVSKSTRIAPSAVRAASALLREADIQYSASHLEAHRKTPDLET